MLKCYLILTDYPPIYEYIKGNPGHELYFTDYLNTFTKKDFT